MTGQAASWTTALIISAVVQEAACPVIALLDTDDAAMITEAAKRGVFAYVILNGRPQDLENALDITLRRFAEFINLQGAFGRRALIEQAKGILMARNGIGADEAYQLLKHQSQATGRKLVDIAEAVTQSYLLIQPAHDEQQPPQALVRTSPAVRPRARCLGDRGDVKDLRLGPPEGVRYAVAEDAHQEVRHQAREGSRCHGSLRAERRPPLPPWRRYVMPSQPGSSRREMSERSRVAVILATHEAVANAIQHSGTVIGSARGPTPIPPASRSRSPTTERGESLTIRPRWNGDGVST